MNNDEIKNYLQGCLNEITTLIDASKYSKGEWGNRVSVVREFLEERISEDFGGEVEEPVSNTEIIEKDANDLPF